MQQQLELKTSHVADVQSRLEELQSKTETTRNKLQTQVVQEVAITGLKMGPGTNPPELKKEDGKGF